MIAVPDEAATFAAGVARLVADIPTPDRWTPGAHTDDRVAALAERLSAMGWYELATEPDALATLGAAGVELGRGLVAFAEVDALLGGGLAVASDQAGEAMLARYPRRHAVAERDGRLALLDVADAEQRAFIDAQAVHAVRLVGPAQPVAAVRVRSWTAASTGYLAGLADHAVQTAVEYARTRRAFGKHLADLDVVQAMLAAAATTAAGLQRAAVAAPSPQVLLYAGHAASRVLKDCHQVCGALGFTLEFGVQRYGRRAVALASWHDSVCGALIAGTRS